MIQLLEQTFEDKLIKTMTNVSMLIQNRRRIIYPSHEFVVERQQQSLQNLSSS